MDEIKISFKLMYYVLVYFFEIKVNFILRMVIGQ